MTYIMLSIAIGNIGENIMILVINYDVVIFVLIIEFWAWSI